MEGETRRFPETRAKTSSLLPFHNTYPAQHTHPIATQYFHFPSTTNGFHCLGWGDFVIKVSPATAQHRAQSRGSTAALQRIQIAVASFCPPGGLSFRIQSMPGHVVTASPGPHHSTGGNIRFPLRSKLVVAPLSTPLPHLL